jgi:broad specificity phosphatase PhoE
VSKHRPPIYFVRHGETDWNVQGLIQGWTDTPLNEKGHVQAKSVARALAAMPELSEARFVVSPLLRARQTMGHIAEALSLDEKRVAQDKAVMELGFGVWEGKPFWELKASPTYPAHPEDRYHWRPERGESYADGHTRMRNWLATLDRPTVVVAHGAIGRCLIAEIAGLGARELVELTMHQGFYCRLEGAEARWFDATARAV